MLFGIIRGLKMLKRVVLAIGVVIGISGCTDFTPAVQNPEVNDAELQAEIEVQKQKQEQYRQDHPDVKPEDATPIYESVWEYDAFFVATSERLLQSAAELCQYKMYRMGFLASASIPGTVPGKYQQNPKVYGVTKNFPADTVGMQKGDIILKINGVYTLDDGTFIKNYQDSYRRPTSTVTYYDVSEKTEKQVTINAVETCQMEIITSDDDVLNAMADGNTIYMYPALYDFLEKEQFITAVIAHEIAHNILSHMKRGSDTFRNTTLATGLGLLIAKNVFDQDISTEQIVQGSLAAGSIARLYYSPTLESEADYVGIYLMARAGYDIDGVEETWRRMSLLRPDGSGLNEQFLGTHPSTPKRFVALTKTTEEIEQKKQQEDHKHLMPIFTNQSLDTIKSKQKPLY